MFKHIDSSKRALIAVGVAAVLFFAVNMISNIWFSNIRADFTEGRAYTTSKQIAPIFEGITEPIVIRLYYSEEIGKVSPRHGQYYQRVRDLLQQYTKLAHGMIKLELYNPARFSDVEDRAVGFGLRGLALNDNGDVGYFGLAATNSTDDVQVIPFFSVDRDKFLEYDLTKLVYNLARPEQPTIGLITSLKIEGGEPGPDGAPLPAWAFLQQVKEFFHVQTLAIDVPIIPADVNLLLLVQPTNLPQATQQAIDQFVLGGGKALVFVDPNAEAANLLSTMGVMGKETKGDLEGIKRLLTSWGVNLIENKVVGDIDSAIRINMAENGRPILSDYVAWMSLNREHLDPNDSITGDLTQINLGTSGVLEPVEGATTTMTPLIVTGERSERIDIEKFSGMPDIVGMFRDFKPSGRREVLAARVTGPAKSAFANAPAAALKESKDPINVIVVADSDILADRFWVQMNDMGGQNVMVPTADNGSFVTNALENLSGTAALSSLRGRGVTAHPFTLLDNIRRDAEMQYRSKEQALTDRLTELQKQVDAMQVKRDGTGAAVLSDADKKTIESYRADILSTRRELRDVQGALRENIERLQSTITFANIGGVPILFGLILITVAVVRIRRRRRRATDL